MQENSPDQFAADLKDIFWVVIFPDKFPIFGKNAGKQGGW
jgi:hypothetical protein